MLDLTSNVEPLFEDILHKGFSTNRRLVVMTTVRVAERKECLLEKQEVLWSPSLEMSYNIKALALLNGVLSHVHDCLTL